jgi:hypothetical protein
MWFWVRRDNWSFSSGIVRTPPEAETSSGNPGLNLINLVNQAVHDGDGIAAGLWRIA